MRFTRRRLFSVLAYLGLVLRWLPAAGRPLGPDEIAHQRLTLRAFIDALIPRDETPGAIDLDVHMRLFEQADEHAPYARMLGFGAGWLDEQAQQRYGRRFINLNSTEKDAVIETAAAAPRRAPHHRFFSVTRSDVFEWYWSHRDSWARIGFDGPPQPRGFPDFDKPPRGNG